MFLLLVFLFQSSISVPGVVFWDFVATYDHLCDLRYAYQGMWYPLDSCYNGVTVYTMSGADIQQQTGGTPDCDTPVDGPLHTVDADCVTAPLTRLTTLLDSTIMPVLTREARYTETWATNLCERGESFPRQIQISHSVCDPTADFNCSRTGANWISSYCVNHLETRAEVTVSQATAAQEKSFKTEDSMTIYRAVIMTLVGLALVICTVILIVFGYCLLTRTK